MKRNNCYIKGIATLVLFILTIPACKKYLDKKSDESLVVPSTIKDASLLLDLYGAMNNQYPYVGTLSEDDSYFLDATFNTRPDEDKLIYTWDKQAMVDEDWTRLYKIVSIANLAIQTLEEIQVDDANKSEFDRVFGSALFYRGYAFYHIAQYFAEPYDKSVASQKLGIPLRLTADISVPSVRSSMEETYKQMVNDFLEASKRLPLNNPPLSRPNKIAAFAALARLYLTMDEFSLAKGYADSCLNLYSTLMDYNDPSWVNSSPSAQIPFKRWNPEVIFQATNLGTSIGVPTTGRIDSSLFLMYGSNDLRRRVFFRTLSPGVGFKGNYDGTRFGSNFSGLAVDEIFLIRAECYARLGNITDAMNDLNTLLSTRWAAGTFVLYTASDASDALRQILVERRKELVGRGLRWFDLRRLNKHSDFAKSLTRLIDGQAYSLPPNDPRYTFPIPRQVIEHTGMMQNNR